MIRRVIEFALDKPLLNHMLLLFIFVMAAISYVNVPKEIFPPIQMDKVNITGGYSGTSADVLDKMVVQTIEDELKNIDNLDMVTTTIKNGQFSIMVDIKPAANNVAVLNDVKDVIDGVKRDLPSDMNDPVAQIHENVIPLAIVAVAGDVETAVLLDHAEALKTKLSGFKELSEIIIRGDADEELVIRLNEEKIRALGFDIASVAGAIQGLSSIFPIGTIKQTGEHLYISTYNGEKRVEALEETLIGIAGKRIRLGDLADIRFELSDETELSHYNGLRNVSLSINKSEQGNAIILSKEIRALLDAYGADHPELKFKIYTDTSVWIKNRLNTVFSNIVFGLILVFLAMMLFVNRGIAMVVGLGIPVSFMIGMIATEAIGQSLNMISLLGALIALGMLVDEAIVVAENIYRHLEEGMERREAVIRGATEMFPAVLTATLTTVFAFLPMLMLSGEMGAFIKILPIMITVLLLSSLLEAFYFLPLHAHDWMKRRKEEHVTHVIWEHLWRWYDRVLHFLFRTKRLSLSLLVSGIIVMTGIMAASSKFQLFPDFDVTQIYVTGQVNINNDLEDTEAIVSRVEKLLLERLDPQDFASVTSVTGIRLDSKNQAELGENLFQIFIDLHEAAPREWFNRYVTPLFAVDYDAEAMIRPRTAREIGDEILTWVEPMQRETGINGPLFEELKVTVPGAGVVAHDIEIALSGKEDAALIEGLDALKAELRTIDGVYNISDDADVGERELKLRVNSYGQQLGFNEQSVNTQLRAYYLKGEYGKMFNDRGLVRIRIEGSAKDHLGTISDFQLEVPGTGQFVALKEVCDFLYERAYVTIKKEDGKRIRSLFASIKKEQVTSTEVMEALAPKLERLRSEGYGVDIKGEEKENKKNQREMGQAFGIAMLLIFITLVWLFDSLKQSAIVLSNIFLVFLGVFIGHAIMGLHMTMPSLIGAVGLAGVVVNDGLIMVSFIRRATDSEELMRLARTRLRPILLTSITTVLGLATLIFYPTGQAQILQPMAVSLGFGLVWATVLNLIYVPLLYAVIYSITPPHPKEA